MKTLGLNNILFKVLILIDFDEIKKLAKQFEQS